MEDKYIENVKTLYALAQLLCQTHQPTLRFFFTLVIIQALLLDCLQEFGTIPSKLSAQSWLFIVPLFAVLCCVVAKRAEEEINTSHQRCLRSILKIR